MVDLMNEEPSETSDEEKRKPATARNYQSIAAFIRYLNDRNVAPDGWNFVVPFTEMWEYAYLAGDPRDHNLGNGGWESAGEITTVGEFKGNEWGFKDMFGNVAEYCVGSQRCSWLLGGDYRDDENYLVPIPDPFTKERNRPFKKTTGFRIALVSDRFVKEEGDWILFREPEKPSDDSSRSAGGAANETRGKRDGEI